MSIVQPIKCHGGKHYLAPKIIALMPPHTHYVEPFFGGGSVLLTKDPRGVSEVINDRWGVLVNFWQVLRDPSSFRQFLRAIEATPLAEPEWNRAELHPIDADGEPCVTAAAEFFVRARQSRQGLCRDFATLSRNRTRRGMNEQVSSWLTSIDGLPEVHARLRRVAILCRDAGDVIQQQDGPKTLFYCDPPYLHDTRAVRKAYAHEMTEADHRQLLETIDRCAGRVLLSGYRNPLYDRKLRSWNRRDFKIDNKASGAATKRIVTESVWCNF